MVDQPRRVFFQSLLHFKLFGVMKDELDLQTNLIFRKGGTKKGENVVTSLLDRYLSHLKEKYGTQNVNQIRELCIHADNLVGQNKNNTMIWLLPWFVYGNDTNSYAFETSVLKFMVKGILGSCPTVLLPQSSSCAPSGTFIKLIDQ